MNGISVAIVSWNTRELLDQCLASVYRSDPGCEIVVVDNASEDGSPDMVADKYPEVKLVRSKVNMGFAAGCNLAAKHSTGRYLLLLNSDTIVLDGALTALAGFMDEHPDAGAAGCRLLNADGTLQRSCSVFPSLTTELFDALYLSKLFPKSRIFARYSMSWWDFNETREVDFVGGSCLIARREAIEEVGLLDEGYFMYTEEADWCYRMWRHGWKVYYYPEAQIIHLGGRSARRYGSDILVHLYASRNRFLRKHRGPAVAAVHRGIVALGALLRLAAFKVRPEPGAIRFQRSLLRWALGSAKLEGGV
ncbi:MAG: glycosyltransferase family 2 protein [Armatimonadota bacterium]